MRLTSPTLRSAVVAEYALGNLSPRAARRFERLLFSDDALRSTLQDWRNGFDSAAVSASVTPPPEVWSRINRELDQLEAPRRRPWADSSHPSLRRWQACAGLASAAAVIFAALLLAPSTSTNSDARASFETATDGTHHLRFWPARAAAHAVSSGYATTLQLPRETSARWRISLSADSRLLRVQSVGYPMLEADEDYELWWVGEHDIVPVGLLPRNGSWMLSLPRELQMTSASRLVITREPALGSPADGPTGPVLVNTSLRPQA